MDTDQKKEFERIVINASEYIRIKLYHLDEEHRSLICASLMAQLTCIMFSCVNDEDLVKEVLKVALRNGKERYEEIVKEIENV